MDKLSETPGSFIDKNIANEIDIEYVNKYYSKEKSDRYFIHLNNLPYDEDSVVVVYNKVHKIPRHQIAYGDVDITYAYSQNNMNTLYWTDELLEMKEKIEAFLDTKFNFCLINRYMNSDHNIGYHRDNEKELGYNPIIAGLSFGSSRDILFKNKKKNILKKYELTSGSLLIMRNQTNKYWYHSISKRKNVNNIRISVTFRYIV